MQDYVAPDGVGRYFSHIAILSASTSSLRQRTAAVTFCCSQHPLDAAATQFVFRERCIMAEQLHQSASPWWFCQEAVLTVTVSYSLRR